MTQTHNSYQIIVSISGLIVVLFQESFFSVCFFYILVFTGQIFSGQAFPSWLTQSLKSVKEGSFVHVVSAFGDKSFPRSLFPSWQRVV